MHRCAAADRLPRVKMQPCQVALLVRLHGRSARCAAALRELRRGPRAGLRPARSAGPRRWQPRHDAAGVAQHPSAGAVAAVRARTCTVERRRPTPPMGATITDTDRVALGGRATRKQVTLGFGTKPNGPAMHLLIYLPNARKGARSGVPRPELPRQPGGHPRSGVHLSRRVAAGRRAPGVPATAPPRRRAAPRRRDGRSTTSSGAAMAW